MVYLLRVGVLAIVLAVVFPAASRAELGVRPAAALTKGADVLAMSDSARLIMAEFQLKDVHPGSGVPEVFFGDLPLRFSASRSIIDARIINIFFLNRARFLPPTYAATTGQAIDAWTNTVLFGSPSGYGSSVDQWVAMAYYMGPL